MHGYFMRRCIELALEAKGRGDTPVGSLVVRSGEIVAEASELLPSGLDPSAHAELIALREACRALGSRWLEGCILYSTAEPCFMCSYAVRQTRIDQVVIGHPVPKVGGVSSEFAVLTAPIEGWGPPPRILMGVLKRECAALRTSG